jgi:PAS domain S-box-containing protein
MTKKCLVADNNQLYLEFFSDVMSSFGYEVVKAMDGLEALDLARENDFDLFVLDFVMPKIDGVRLSKYLKAMRKYKKVPVILVTAAALESVRWDDRENFADIFVAKGPFEKMKEIFNEMMPNIETLVVEQGRKILGLENIYPRQIVKELLKAGLNHSAIFQNLVEGVVELDEHCKIIFANSSFCKILGQSEDEVIGNDIAGVLDFYNRPELKESMEKVVTSGKLKRESIVCSVSDKVIHFSFYNIFDYSAGFAGSFIILQDISGIKKKIEEIGALFNITQAFLSNLPYKNVLEYVTHEMRRLIKATNVTLLLSCDGIFKGETINTVDRKLDTAGKKKIGFWVDKINEWKKDGLINLKSVSKMNKVKFENLPILWFPLAFQDKYIGTLLGFKAENQEFEDEEMRFFEAIGNQIAVYVSNIEFFCKAQGSEEEVGKIKQEVELLAKTQSENIFNQNIYLRWEERNKRKIIHELTEDMARLLTTFEGCIKLLEEEGTEAAEKNKKAIMENMLNTFGKIAFLKEDLSLLNKMGSGSESEMRVFSMDILMRKLTESTKGSEIVFAENIPSFQRLGDFEKLVFGIRMLLNEIKRKDGNNISVGFDTCNENINMIISFRLKYNETEDLFSTLLSEQWEEYNDCFYYFFWHLKLSMSVFNGKVSFKAANDQLFITLGFPAYNKKGESHEKV